MPEPRRDAAPWIAAAVAAVLFAGALLLFLFVEPDESSARDGRQAFTTAENDAVSAAGTETANLLSFRRAHFDADFKRALAGATGSLLKDIRGKKAQTLKAMTAGKFDLIAEVNHSALVGPVDDDKVDGYVVLVNINGYRSIQKNQPVQQNLRVTVVKKNGKWLANDVRNITVVGA